MAGSLAVEFEPDDAGLLGSLENRCQIEFHRQAVARRAYVHEASEVGWIGVDGQIIFSQLLPCRWGQVGQRKRCQGSANSRSRSMQWACMVHSLCGDVGMGLREVLWTSRTPCRSSEGNQQRFPYAAPKTDHG